MLPRVRAIVESGIPVMGHIGLTPQSVTALGGYKAQGGRRQGDAAARRRAGAPGGRLLLARARGGADAGGRAHHRGADDPDHRDRGGPHCDGQVLVYHDLLGLTEGHVARFVKRYADLATVIREALRAFAADIRSGAYPEERHTYGMPADELAAFEKTTRTPTTSSTSAQTTKAVSSTTKA